MIEKIFRTTIFCILFLLLSPTLLTLAEVLESDNYKLVGVTTQGGGVVESTNYASLLTVNESITDPRLFSTNYKMYADPAKSFRPAVPTVSCFETTTDGYSNCTTGPSELTTGGMVALCGSGGCHDRARFEINIQANPSDTLYAVQISTDNFVSDIQYIDASSYQIETYSNHNINDFRTKTQWETDTFNILGLDEGTQYYLRLMALHGDFTQTEPSPTESATTAGISSFFDIDIGPTSNPSIENDPPFEIAFEGDEQIYAGAGVSTADDLIWMDASTNGNGGFSIIAKGEYGGLYSPTLDDTISSITGDLNSIKDGFGLQSYYNTTTLGTVEVGTNYSGTNNNVGVLSDTDWNTIYYSEEAVTNARLALYLKARAGIDKQGETDYTETVTFIFVTRY